MKDKKFFLSIVTFINPLLFARFMAWEFITQNIDIVWALIILVIILVVVKAIFMIIHSRFRKLAKKTKSTFDDALVCMIGQPVYWVIVLIGANLILKDVNYAVQHAQQLNLGFKIAWAVWGMFLMMRIVKGLIEWYISDAAIKSKVKIEATALSILKRIIYVVIIIVGVMVVLSYLGVAITPLIASLGIGGLAVALALQDTLANYFSGIYISTDKSISLGEYIELDQSGDNDLKGYVDRIGWRTTRIKTLSNNFVIVPNRKLAESVITNYDQPDKQMCFSIDIGVAYGSDLDKVEKVTIDVAKQVIKKVDGAVKNFEPFIRFKEFGDSNIKFAVNLRVQEFVNQYLLKHEFIKALKKRYDKEKIEISLPATKVYVRK